MCGLVPRLVAQKRTSTSQQSPGWGGVGEEEGRGAVSQVQLRTRPGATRASLNPQASEGCPSKGDVAMEQVPSPRAPEGEAPLVLAPLHSLSHGSQLGQLCTRQSPPLWPSSPLGLWGPPAEQHLSHPRGHSLIPLTPRGPPPSLAPCSGRYRGKRPVVCTAFEALSSPRPVCINTFLQPELGPAVTQASGMCNQIPSLGGQIPHPRWAASGPGQAALESLCYHPRIRGLHWLRGNTSYSGSSLALLLFCRPPEPYCVWGEGVVGVEVLKYPVPGSDSSPRSRRAEAEAELWRR